MKERQETKSQTRQAVKGHRRATTESQEHMLSDVEFLILALVQNGLRSAYDLKKRAGISVGTSVPVLARLHGAGLLDQSDVDQRNARRYLTTTAGAQTLTAAWRTFLNSRPADVDSIIRIGYLAWTLGNDHEASAFLQQAATTLHARAATMKAEASELFNGVQHELHGNAYRWLRTCCDVARLHASAEEIAHLADQISDMGRTKSGREEKRGSGRRSRR
jgi:DNA-binding PadR family transcriptional regulator